MKSNTAASSQQLFQWIRNLNGQYCKSVKTFSDLRTGLALGDIVAEVYQSFQIIHELNPHNLANPNNCVGNLNNILCEIKSQSQKNGIQFPSHLSGITPAVLYEDNDQLQTLCEWLFLQKKLIQMRSNGYQCQIQNQSVKRPPLQIQQPNGQSCDDENQGKQKNMNFIKFQPPVSGLSSSSGSFAKKIIDYSNQDEQMNELQASSVTQNEDQYEENEKKHNSSQSSEPELFYASDLNFIPKNDHFESFNEESKNVKQSTFKSLENNYQVIRPSSPFQNGSQKFKPKIQNQIIQKTVQFDPDHGNQKFDASENQQIENKKSSSFQQQNQGQSLYISSAESSALKSNLDKSSLPLQQQDLANSFDSQNNFMKVAHFLNDKNNKKGWNGQLSSSSSQQINDDSMINNSFQSKKGIDNQYQQQENNQKLSNMLLPPPPISQKTIKTVKSNQINHQHSNSFTHSNNSQLNSSLCSNQNNSAQKIQQTSQVSQINKITGVHSAQKEVQKISANFSVSSSSGYINSSLNLQGEGIMNSNSKEKLKKEIKQLEQSIKEESMLQNQQDDMKIKNNKPPQSKTAKPQSSQNYDVQNSQNSNRNIPTSSSSRLSHQNFKPENNLQKNNNTSDQLTKNRSNQSLIEPSQQSITPTQSQQNHKKNLCSFGGNQSNEFGCGNKNININSKIRSYSHQHSTQNSESELQVFQQGGDTFNNIKQKELNITPCTEQQKDRCLKWLYEICLIKKDIKDIKDKLPKVCKNGVIYLDIINRIQGKGETIPGVIRNTKNISQIRANYIKLFSYIRKFEKMNPRYLFNSDEYLLNGNQDVFWGFLDDLWHFFHNKQSPLDQRSENYQVQFQKQNNSELHSGKKLKSAYQDENYNEMLFNANQKSGQKQQNGNKFEQNNQSNTSINFQYKYNNNSSNQKNMQNIPNKIENNSVFSKQPSNSSKQCINTLKTHDSTNNLSINGNSLNNQQQNIFTPKYKDQRNCSLNSPILSPKSTQNTNNDNYSQKNNFTRQNTTNNLNQSYTSQRKSLSNLNANNSSYKKLSNYKDMHTQRQAAQLYNTPTRRCSTRRTSRDNLINQSQSPSNLRQRINTVHTFNHNSYYSNMNIVNSSFQKCNSQSKQTNHNNSFHAAFSPCANRTPSKGLSNSKNQNTPKVLPITLEMEMQTNQFLNKLGFHSFIVKKDKKLFEDPLRNGTLICKLIEKLNQRIDRYYASPKNIEECRFNIESALQTLRSIQDNLSIPFYLLFKGEEIIKGEHDAIWGLLYNIMKNQENIKQSDQYIQAICNSKNDEGFPITSSGCTSQHNNSDIQKNGNHEYNKQLFGISEPMSPLATKSANEDNNEYQGGNVDTTQEIHLPYSTEQISKLEASTIKWVNSKTNKTYTSFLSIYSSIRNGILLCSLVSSVTNRQIIPSHSQPTSDHNCLANIQKALAPLRIIKNIGQRFLWKEYLILQANHSIILGLIEDLRRYSDGLPARKGDNYFEEGPYYGLSLVKQNQNLTERCSDNSISVRNRQEMDIITNHEVQNDEKSKNLQQNNPQQNLLQKLHEQKPYSLIDMNTKNEDTFSNDQFNDKFNQGVPVNQFINRAYQLIQENAKSVQNNHIYQQINQIKQSETNQSQQIRTLLGNFQKKQQQIFEEQNTSSSKYVNQFIQPQQQGFSNQDISFKPQQQEIENQSPLAINIISWLNDIGLQDIAKSLDLSQPSVPMFKDGLIICKIIEKLDQTRIPGLINNPKTSASCLVNIRKAFFILQKKTDFDSKLLLDETLVYESKINFVISFLNQLKHCFKNQSRYLQKLKKNEIVRESSNMIKY